MSSRRTNVGLLLASVAALFTGAVAFGLGTGWNAWATVAHGVAGVAIVLLSPWKTAIARRGLARERRGRNLSLLLFVLVIAALVSGFLHSFGVNGGRFGVTAMQVHVGAALIALPFIVWHVIARPARPQRVDLERRQLLRTGLLAGGAAAGYAALRGVEEVAGLAAADRRFTGSHERGSGRPADMPVTQWLNDAVPSIDVASWRLRVDGRDWSYDELTDLNENESMEAVLDCTGGWFARQTWEGVSLARLIEPIPGARSIVVTSHTGYSRSFPLEDAPKLMLATRVGGEPLSPGHGYPVRLVAPGRRGFWWVKWVEWVESSTRPWWAQSPFPLT